MEELEHFIYLLFFSEEVLIPLFLNNSIPYTTLFMIKETLGAERLSKDFEKISHRGILIIR